MSKPWRNSVFSVASEETLASRSTYLGKNEEENEEIALSILSNEDVDGSISFTLTPSFVAKHDEQPHLFGESFVVSMTNAEDEGIFQVRNEEDSTSDLSSHYDMIPNQVVLRNSYQTLSSPTLLPSTAMMPLRAAINHKDGVNLMHLPSSIETIQKMTFYQAFLGVFSLLGVAVYVESSVFSIVAILTALHGLWTTTYRKKHYFWIYLSLNASSAVFGVSSCVVLSLSFERLQHKSVALYFAVVIASIFFILCGGVSVVLVRLTWLHMNQNEKDSVEKRLSQRNTMDPAVAV